MYLLYVDESGTPESSGGTSHFILLGIAIPDNWWQKQTSQIEQLKAKYGLASKELHAAWMLRRYVEQEKIPDFAALNRNERRDAVLKERKIGRRLAAAKSTKAVNSLTKNYRKTEAYIHLTLQERKQVILEAAKLVASWGDSRLFGEAISKPHFKLPHDPFQEAFMQVVSRFEAFLVNYGKATGRALKGIIVQDNNATEAMRLTRLMRKFQTSGTEWRDINNIVETPLFVDSQLTDMVQVADICAYATRRFFENGETGLFDIIYPRFDRIGDRVVGLRHYTGGELCGCKVCMDHRKT